MADVLQIRFLADPSAAFTKALDLGFDGTAIFGGVRGKRYALKVVNGKVAAAHVEPDGTGYKGESHCLQFSDEHRMLTMQCSFDGREGS